MNFKILTINPGSTSTKIAIFENEKEIFTKTIEHTKEELKNFPDVISQYDYRKKLIEELLKDNGFDMKSLSAIVGRGGLLPPVQSGAYIVNNKMIEDLKQPGALHASNLGAVIADAIAAQLVIPAYIYDAISSNELSEVAQITGFPEFTRNSYCHVLNSKAMGRKYGKQVGKKYEELNIIVAHLGGGITISAHENGRIIDSESDNEGPFSPERSGVAPLLYVVEMCYSGNYDKNAMLMKIRGAGGLKAHLGTSDCREIEKMIENGDSHAKLIYEAQAYQISKGIGMMLPVLNRIDAIILTGGIAYSKMLTEMVKKQVEKFAPVVIMPGENEMESLALGGLRILRGEEEAKEYV